MKRFILAPDSFKGTMSAIEVCDIIENAILHHIPDAVVDKLPMADGGEGMVDAFVRICGGEKQMAVVAGPFGAPVPAQWACLPNGDAVVEMAAAAGLDLAWGSKAPHECDPMVTTTRGVGDLLLAAKQSGAKSIILGLGGSATNDGGMGMAAALGYRFLDENGSEVPLTGGGLAALARIDPPEKPFGVKVFAACDVDNPLCGANGAAQVFGPQKGASPLQVQALDKGLANLARLIRRDLGVDVADVPGAGAAGGLGAGVLAFLGGNLSSGIDMLLDAAGFDGMLTGADMVITGEGRMDGQTARGKVPIGIARRTKKNGVPCIALCGSSGGDISSVYRHGITAVFTSIRDAETDFAAVKADSKAAMAQLADSVMRLLILPDAKTQH